jgi:hypothetical protein
VFRVGIVIFQERKNPFGEDVDEQADLTVGENASRSRRLVFQPQQALVFGQVENYRLRVKVLWG